MNGVSGSFSDRNPQARGRLLAALVRELDFHQVITRPPEDMLRTRVSFFRFSTVQPSDFIDAGALPSPKSHVSSPNLVRHVRTKNVNGCPERTPIVGQ